MTNKTLDNRYIVRSVLWRKIISVVFNNELSWRANIKLKLLNRYLLFLDISYALNLIFIVFKISNEFKFQIIKYYFSTKKFMNFSIFLIYGMNTHLWYIIWVNKI